MRRIIRLSLFAFACFGVVLSPAAAQTWPTRPVTMVVPFAAGGGTDLLGRIVAKRLAEVLGQQVVIENIGGAGGMIGSARVVKSAPDGYTMVVGTTADAINQTLYKAPLYNFAADLVPAGLMGDQPTVLLARKDFPANTLQEFDHLSPDPFAIFFDPPALDDRITNQYALFSTMSSPDAILDQWLADKPDVYQRIIIPAELKWEVRDKLDLINITERVLFPGLDGLCGWLKRYYSPRVERKPSTGPEARDGDEAKRAE